MKVRARHVLVALAATMGLLVAALFAAALVVRSYVHRHEPELIAQLEQRLGRKVEIGRWSVSLWSGLTAEKVTIGGSDAAGDAAPLITVERIHARPHLLPTLVTLGRRAQLGDIELSRATVTVVRFADGSFNLDRVADHWQKSAPAAQPAQPISDRTRRLIENARLQRARITDGQVRFVDLRAGGGRAVEVSGIELTLADVGIKRRPSVALRAAVLAAQPNLELQAQLGEAGSLERLPPPIESARLKLARTDLGPLMPLIERFVGGLDAGEASADLELRATGAAELKGEAQLHQARFPGGAPFDASLAVDVREESRDRSFDVRRLDVAVGEMALVAHGRLQSLAAQPRFDGFSLATRNLDFDELRRIYPQLDRRAGATLHGPLALSARASGQEFSAVADLTGASIAARGFDKPRGTPWRIDARGHAHKNVVELDALTLAVAQQTLRGHGTVRLGEKHPLIDAYAASDRLSVAALAPLVPSLAAAGLPPLVVSANAHVSGRVGLPATMAVDVDRLAVTSRKSELVGSVKLRNFERPQLELAVRSSYLDTADLLPSPSKSTTTTTTGRGQPAPKRGGGAPDTLAHLGGHANVSVTRGVASGVPFDGLQADLALRDGAVHANQLAVGAWGGRVVADGSDFDLARGPFHLRGDVRGVDVEPMMARVADARQVLSGHLSARLDVRGQGVTPAELERSLAGTLDGAVEDARLLAFNLDNLVVGELLRALPLSLPTARLTNATNLGTLRGRLRFADGAVMLDKPLTASTPEGPIELAGRFYFDGRLDLTGTFGLNAQAASALFANRVRLSEPLPLGIRLGGSIHRPTLAIANVGDAAKVLMRGAASALIPGRQQAKLPVNEQLGKDAIDKLKGLLGH